MKSCPTCQATYPGDFTVCPRDGSPLQLTTDLNSGLILRGKYQILSKIGEGGMGVVYKVRHVHFDEVFAIKVVSPSLLTDPGFMQRFRTEALLMRKLDHPHAVRVQDYDETEDGRPFMVMEFVEGLSLDRLLAEEPLFDVRRAIRITMQACEALAAAHKLGIVHRDIKPSNMLVTRMPDGTDHVKVLDFGVAKVKEGSMGQGASLTRTGFVVGTPDYMSPEQCQGARGDKLDGRSDLYSLGVVLYQLVTGHLPFSADTPVMMLMAHVQKQAPDPRSLREIPGPLASLVMRALEKEAALRFPSAEAMRDALKAVLEFDEINLGGTIRVIPRRAATERPKPPEPERAQPVAPADVKTEVVTPQPGPAVRPPAPAAEQKTEVVTPPPRPAVRPPTTPPEPPPAPIASGPAPPPAPRVTQPQPQPAEPAPRVTQPQPPASEPRRAPARQPFAPAPEPPSRSPVAFAAIGALAMLLVAGGGYFAWNRIHPSPEPQPPPIDTRPAPPKSETAAPPAEKKTEEESIARPPDTTRTPPPPIRKTVTPEKTRETIQKNAAPPVNPNAQEVQRLMQQGASALDAGRYDEAIRTFEAVLLLEPGLPAARRGLDRARRAKAAEEAILKGKP